MTQVSVYYLPQFVAESDLAGATVAVVDLLRASTTICQALTSGATSVVPCLEVREAVEKASEIGRDKVVLGGERGGEIIPGFDLGNSPAEFTPAAVFGRRVIFTTTNGTRALQHARLANRVVVAAAVNRAAVVENLAADERVVILCAGTNGVVSREDILAAGAIADGLADRGAELAGEWAHAARGEWQELANGARALGKPLDEHYAVELRNTPGGKNLLGIGMDADLVLCAQLDTLEVVPQVHPCGEIR